MLYNIYSIASWVCVYAEGWCVYNCLRVRSLLHVHCMARSVLYD